MRRRSTILSGLATAVLAAAAGSASAAVTALVGGTLVDGTGTPPINNSVVLIDGARIVAAGRRDAIAIPSDAAVVSTVGLTVLPGLIDIAVHLDQLGHGSRARWHEAYEPLTDKVVLPVAARALLSAGVTTARDIGTPLERTKPLRQRIDAGKTPGPSLLLSGAHLGRSAHGREHEWVAHTATELRQAVQKMAAQGADLLILDDAAEYSPGELSTLHYAAEDAGLRWFAWVQTDADIAPSVQAGAYGLIGLGTDFHEALPADAAVALASRAAGGRPVYWALGASVLINHEWLRSNAAPLG